MRNDTLFVSFASALVIGCGSASESNDEPNNEWGNEPAVGQHALALTSAQTPPNIDLSGTFRYAPTAFQGFDVADVTADGIPDVVTAIQDAMTVQVHRGNGDLSFKHVISYSMGMRTSNVFVREVTGDGVPDLLVLGFVLSSGTTQNFLRVVPGTPGGLFNAAGAVNYPLGPFPQGLTVGHFDGDGLPDIAISNAGPKEIEVFLHSSPTSFFEGPTIPVGVNLNRLLAADLDGNGRQDLVVTAPASSSLDSSIMVFAGNGDGSFGAGVRYASAAFPVDVALADLDGDGANELLHSNNGARSVSIREVGSGGLLSAAANLFASRDPGRIAIGDLDRDGIVDAVVDGADYMSVFYGGASLAADFAPVGLARGVQVSDFDRDGRLDVIARKTDGTELIIWPGRADGGVGRATYHQTASIARNLAAGSLNGDAHVDFVVLTDSLDVYLGAGDGSFTLASSNAFTGTQPSDVALGDLNRDGRTDVVTSMGRFHGIEVRLGNGNGTLGAATNYVVRSEFPLGRSVTLTDLNLDRNVDVVLAGPAAELNVLLGAGDGTLVPSGTVILAAETRFVEDGDFDGDSRRDLAVGTATGVVTLRGQGDGSFAAPVALETSTVNDVDVMDVDDDGAHDIVVTSFQELRIHFGRGDGSFDAPVRLAASQSMLAAAIGDLNRDGQKDIAVTHAFNKELGFFQQEPDGTFRTLPRVPTGERADNLALADVDRDGTQDLAVATFAPSRPATSAPFHDSLTVFRGNVPPTVNGVQFTQQGGGVPARVDFSVSASDPDGTLSRFRWDFDDDGIIDAVTTSIHASHVYETLSSFNVEVQAVDDDGAATATTLTVDINSSPTALCTDVAAVAGPACTASVAPSAVDDGSTDPDADLLTLSLSPPGPFALGSTAVTLSVNDGRGAADSCEASIEVVDETAPSASCPPNVALECPADAHTSTTGQATSQDNCSVASTTFEDTVEDQAGLTETITRTFRVTDGTGNSAQCSQVIQIVDTTAPSLTCPSNRTLECPADTSSSLTGVASALDGCGNAAVIASDVVDPGPAQTGSIARTFTATDENGNQSACTQIIVVVDTTQPQITCPPDLVIECPGDDSPQATGLASAVDACGSAAVAHSDVLSPGPGLTRVVERTWTAVDLSGNSASCVQIISVVDTTVPAVACPSDANLECPADTSVSANGTASASDVCSTVAIVHEDTTIPGCGGTETVSRRWIATDELGNMSECDQHIAVVDTTAPVIANLSASPLLQVVSTPIDYTTNFSDTCSTIQSVSWNFGDGTPLVQGSVTSPSSTSHAYSQPDLYTTGVTVADACANTSLAEVGIAVFDPEGAGSTGAGWFVSEVGATGEVHFQFTLSYRDPGMPPKGRLTFRYAGLVLEATSFDWLVVSGDQRVSARGLATLDGTGTYTFKLVATDRGAGQDSDAVTLQVWSGIVDTENKAPTPLHLLRGTLAGGNIVIQQ